jgi:hypothetical protein
LWPSKHSMEVVPRLYRSKYGKADSKAVDGETRELFDARAPTLSDVEPANN